MEKKKKFVFIAGLHKSGTSILFKCLRTHPLISGFKNTGFPQDEGQFLQTIYPIAKNFGGPGKFGFDTRMHLTELSDLTDESNKKNLFQEWSCHWNLSKPVLLEKSPPNLLKTRFLQAMFPHTYFIVVIRHPIATSYATMEWSKTPLINLLEHWVHCHEIFSNDCKLLNNYFLIKYEDFVRKPSKTLENIYEFIGIKKHPTYFKIEKGTNIKYFEKWISKMKNANFQNKNVLSQNCQKIEKQINKFGYSLYDLR